MSRERRDVVEVRGPDAVGFLQGQCSQDLAGLAVGASAWTFVLQPTGKVDGFARATRVADDAVLLDTDEGAGDDLVARLQRFKLRVKADLVRHEGWSVVGEAEAAGAGTPVVGWWGEGVERLCPPGPDAAASEADRTRARIEAGWPALGAELTADTIPAESGLVPVAVSFTKGCYTGQELVARIDSRGNHVPRHLRRLRSATDLVAGEVLLVDGAEVGRVTSAAGGSALGYLGRAVPVGAVVATAAGAAVTVEPQRAEAGAAPAPRPGGG